MILDPNKYLASLNAIQALLMLDKGTSPTWRVTEASCVYHIPIIAVAAYALRPDVLGEVPELRRLLARTIEFYRCKRVVPWADLITIDSDATTTPSS